MQERSKNQADGCNVVHRCRTEYCWDSCWFHPTCRTPVNISWTWAIGQAFFVSLFCDGSALCGSALSADTAADSECASAVWLWRHSFAQYNSPFDGHLINPSNILSDEMDAECRATRRLHYFGNSCFTPAIHVGLFLGLEYSTMNVETSQKLSNCFSPGLSMPLNKVCSEVRKRRRRSTPITAE